MKTRPIKFKYWNSQEKKMYYEDTWNDFPLKIDENDVWLEYTGLKDKKGVEIYEGDIIKMLPEKEIGEIEWIDCGFWIRDIDGSNYMPIQKYREVIGNIYESKEKEKN